MNCKHTFLLLILFCLSLTSIHAQTPTEAGEYMDKITGIIGTLKKDSWQYTKVIMRGKGARKVEKRRQELIEAYREVIGQLRLVKPFYGDNTLKKAYYDNMRLAYAVFREDYGKILNMEEIAEQSYDNMEAYLTAKELASQKLDSANELGQLAFRAFALANDITLVEGDADKLSIRIRNAGEVLAYYNDLYLIFFRSYVQESYAMDALKRGDINGLEQSVSAMQSAIAQSKETLEATASFRNDRGLKILVQRMLDFYQKESEAYFPNQVDFYLAKDNFEKTKKVVESKKKKDLTQADIDAYNKAVNDYNNAVNTFNKVNTAYNEQRTDGLEQWNKGIQTFFDRHSK